MTGPRLNADVDQYLQAAALNIPPPQIISDPLVTGATPIEQLLRVLGLAANLGDARDNATSAEQHAERDAKTRQAAEKFAAQDAEAADELNGVATEPVSDEYGTALGPDQTTAMVQQLPQMASSLAGMLAGAVGGFLQPLVQIPQQAAGGLQQAVQAGMGLFQQAADATATSLADGTGADVPLEPDLSSTATDFADPGGGTGGGGTDDIGDNDPGGGAGPGGLAAAGGTAPTAYLGPPPAPSPGTAPSSAPVLPNTPAGAAAAASGAAPGMAGMPMVPPGAMAGTAQTDKVAKPDTKRVSVPPVRNGAPVQGRLTVPPPAVVKAEGRPVVTRRTHAPNSDQSGADQSGAAASDS